MQPNQNNQYWVGIDGGGTKCNAVLTDSNNTVLAVGRGGAANPYQNLSKALNSIETAIAEALAHAGLSPDQHEIIIGMGLAGVNVPSIYKQVQQWQHPYRAHYLTTDLHIACMGAHNGQHGAVIVAGTGSCGYASNGSTILTIGAHGFPCGDKGSGAWLGLSAIQAILLAHDNLAANTQLSELIHQQLQTHSSLAIVERLRNAKQGDYAQFAPLVFQAADAGDAVAVAIVQEGAEYLNSVAKRLWNTGVTRMSMIGSVAQRMRLWMDPELASRIEDPISAPEYGALHYAHTEYERTVLCTS